MKGELEVVSNGKKSIVSKLFSAYPERLIQQEPSLSHVSVSRMRFGGGMLPSDVSELELSVGENAKLRFVCS